VYFCFLVYGSFVFCGRVYCFCCLIFLFWSPTSTYYRVYLSCSNQFRFVSFILVSLSMLFLLLIIHIYNPFIAFCNLRIFISCCSGMGEIFYSSRKCATFEINGTVCTFSWYPLCVPAFINWYPSCYCLVSGRQVLDTVFHLTSLLNL
jgi:hypothetical protein